MSLLRAAIRVAAVAALRDQTWADNRVFDSNNAPLVDALLEMKDADTEGKPYIVVFTDDDDLDRMTDNNLYDGEARRIMLTIETGVATAVKSPDGSTVTIEFAQTDQSMEMSVDVIEMQIKAALFGNPNSEWGDIFKRMAYRLMSVKSKRGGRTDAGVRYAARRTVFVFNTIFDLPPGVVPPPGHPILDLVNLIRTKGATLGILDVAGVFLKMVNIQMAPTWRQAQAYLGLDTEAVKKLVVDGTPLPWPEIEKPPLDTSDTNEFVPSTEEIDLADESIDETWQS